MDAVFHVSTVDQLSYVDAKVRNLLGDDSVEVDDVAVVVDSGRTIDAGARSRHENVAAVLAAGGRVLVCSNALGGAESVLGDLPDGAERASSGVGALTRLQHEGYAYIRP